MENDLRHCLSVLESGGTILYPTDTIWGIGCDATNPSAVEKIFKLKQRTESKSLIILVDQADKLTGYVENIPAITRDLMKNIQTPLTIVYPKGKNLAYNVLAEDHSIAIRVVGPAFFCHELIRRFGKPIVSTSANISGHEPPFSFRHINPDIIKGVDYVVDRETEPIHEIKPSRIIRIRPDGEFEILRK